jgi:glycosyltransferase involved in cell wall biosynthesis
MHIGLVIYGSLDTISGGYLYDRKLVEYLRSQGDVVEIISLPWRSYTVHLLDNIRFKLPRKLDILIEDELNHPSLVVPNRRKHSYPVVSLVHHLQSSELRPAWQNNLYRMIEKKYLESVDGFIFNSKTTKKTVLNLLHADKPSVLAYPPVDRFGAPISQQEIKERTSRDEFRILFLGNVIYRKGLHTLLEAVKELGAKVHLDVVGSLTFEPAYVSLIQEIIEKNQLSSCVVVLHGSLDQETLVDKFKQAHVLVVPSSYEGFGIVYLEGMCFGLPAIGTTAGAAGEVIEPGRTGYLIALNDVKALATYLQSLATDRDLLMRLSLNARERYLRQPSWTGAARNIRDFLRSLL